MQILLQFFVLKIVIPSRRRQAEVCTFYTPFSLRLPQFALKVETFATKGFPKLMLIFLFCYPLKENTRNADEMMQTTCCNDHVVGSINHVTTILA